MAQWPLFTVVGAETQRCRRRPYGTSGCCIAQATGAYLLAASTGDRRQGKGTVAGKTLIDDDAARLVARRRRRTRSAEASPAQRRRDTVGRGVTDTRENGAGCGEYGGAATVASGE